MTELIAPKGYLLVSEEDFALVQELIYAANEFVDWERQEAIEEDRPFLAELGRLQKALDVLEKRGKEEEEILDA